MGIEEDIENDLDDDDNDEDDKDDKEDQKTQEREWKKKDYGNKLNFEVKNMRKDMFEDIDAAWDEFALKAVKSKQA